VVMETGLLTAAAEKVATSALQLVPELKAKVPAKDPVAVTKADSVAPGDVLVFLWPRIKPFPTVSVPE